MSTDKHIDKICIAAIAFCLILTLVFVNGTAIGIEAIHRSLAYETSVFDTSYVHKIEIVMNNWDEFISNCENEEYYPCTVVVDGKQYKNIAIRAKGNTSLSNVKSMGSSRYSFKLEFDHYETGKTLDGLDKLCLNNLIQDNTMMKDYLSYQMMSDFGVDAPLSSFAYLTVNNEDWGLYLAVEAIEDSFLQRIYSSSGNLYKPDSMSFGGGRGNGKNFNMADFDFENAPKNIQENPDNMRRNFPGDMPDNMRDNIPDNIPNNMQDNWSDNMRQKGFNFNDQQAGRFDFKDDRKADRFDFENGTPAPGFDFEKDSGNNKMGFDNGRGSDDVKLKYIDDDPDSYSNIFSSAKTGISEADKERLISSLKDLSNYENLENILDIDEVLRYFVVHNFLCNGDSYTGSMIHNYYLHEADGKLSMIPWDYNLAFGTFQGNSANVVNTSIDDPLSSDMSDRPMLGWIFSKQEYTDEYHKLFEEFIEKWFSSGKLDELITKTAEMIRPYVETDPTKFCTTEEFDAGITAIRSFVSLRAESVENQLCGISEAIDVSGLNISDMGTMNNKNGQDGNFEPEINRQNLRQPK